MDEVQKQAALSAIRTLLAVAGGALAAHGYLNDATVNEIVGAVMTLIPVVWGIVNKYANERHSQERESAAYTAGVNAVPSTTTTEGAKP